MGAGKNQICHFGVGVSELHEDDIMPGDPEYYYWPVNGVDITPQTDYHIENLAYSNNTIVC